MKLPTFLVVLVFLGCSSLENSTKADLILHNGVIYPVSSSDYYGSLASKDGKIVCLDPGNACLELQSSTSEVIDLKGEFAMPGFIEGHGHFKGVGQMAMNLNFLTHRSWEAILQDIEEKAKDMPEGAWIQGRGWHQEKWDSLPPFSVMGYPTTKQLDSLTPDNPVILYHASGHGLFANSAAMKEAGISSETPDPEGGKIIRDAFGKATGVFEENGADPVRKAYSKYMQSQGEEAQHKLWHMGNQAAQEECLKKGITSFQDAGSSYYDIEQYSALAEKGELDLRLWVMLRHSYDEMKDNMAGFPMHDVGNGFFTCAAIKSEVDGALGSHGAWLIEPYEDRKGFTGQNTTTLEEVSNIAGLARKHDMQMCVHAIGDRANREVLNIYEDNFKSNPDKKDWRWRIEHAQHLHPSDIGRFAELDVIASMQAVHCTSDAPFVVKRLGEDRAREGGYAWRALLDNGVIIANGTDAPVEDVDPLPSIYASITRKRMDPEMTFFEEQKMTREEAIYSYTLGNAYAAFQEDRIGSLEMGKASDVVVLSKNLMKCSEDEILQAEILYTIVDGKVKYKKEGS